jgi:hypothetical protein
MDLKLIVYDGKFDVKFECIIITVKPSIALSDKCLSWQGIALC